MSMIHVRALKRAIGTQRPLSDDVRSRAQSYTRARYSQGASQEAIARELGVSQITVSRWLRVCDEAAVLDEPPPAKGPAALVPVEIVDSRDDTEQGASLVVTTPRGLRIEGLNIDALCTVIARLG